MKELKVGERVTIEAVESFGDSDQCKGGVREMAHRTSVC